MTELLDMKQCEVDSRLENYLHRTLGCHILTMGAKYMTYEYLYFDILNIALEHNCSRLGLLNSLVTKPSIQSAIHIFIS